MKVPVRPTPALDGREVVAHPLVPLKALLLPLSQPYVQGPTTSTSAASVLSLCTGTHYKHFCCLCPILMYRDPLEALLLPLSYPYVQGPTTSTSAASVLPLCARTHYKHFCCFCPTLMYKGPLQALLLPLSYPYVQGPTTSTSAASVLPLCARTHYKHFCCLCPTLMYTRTHYKHFCCLCPTLMCKDPLQALLLPLSYPYVQGPTTSTSAASVLSLCTQGPTTSTSAASVLPLCTRTHYKHFCCLCPTLMYRDPLQTLLLPLSYP